MEVDEFQVKSTKKEKQSEKIGKFGSIPDKVLKNLIEKEMRKSSFEIFNQLLRTQNIGELCEKVEEKELYDQEGTIEHTGVSCDGCGVNPIRGVRYKCSVLKDFDYCSTCEESLDHEYSFLKIRKPDEVPEVMLTVIPENAPEVEGESNETFG